MAEGQARVPQGTPLPLLDISDLDDCADTEDPRSQGELEVAPTEGKQGIDTVGERPDAATAEGDHHDSALKYIVCTYARAGEFLGRTHTIDPTWQAKTVCGWRYSEDHIITDDTFGGTETEQIIQTCSACVRREEQRFL